MNDIEKIYEEFGKDICLFPFLAGFYQTNNVVDRSVDTAPNTVRPCSLIRWEGNNPWEIIGTDGIHESRNSDAWKQLRQAFLDGKFQELDCCQTCIQSEKYTGSSPRVNNNDFFVEFLDIDIAQHVREIINNDLESDKVFLLEYFPSNYCNYECVMCGEGPSSKRYTFEAKQFQYNTKIITNDVEKDFREVLENVQLIGFTGGETIIQKQVHNLIDYLIEKDLAKNIVITLLTNLSDYPEKLTGKFQYFKRVLYTLSIDGTHDVVEYQRRGAKWKNIEQNAIRIHNTAYLHEVINFVATSMNILNAIDFVDWCYDHGFNLVTVSPVFRVEYLGPSSMPPVLRNLAMNRLQEGRNKYDAMPEPFRSDYLKIIDQLIGTIEYNPFNPEHLQQFIDHIEIENRASKKPLHEVVPEWAPYFPKIIARLG